MKGIIAAAVLLAAAAGQTTTTPAATTVTLVNGAQAKALGLPQALLVIRCGQDWPQGAAFVSQSTLGKSYVRYVPICSDYVTIPALTEASDLEVMIAPESQQVKPLVLRP